MDESILTSTKKICNLSIDATEFDLDITTHINSALSTVSQLGVGPPGGLFISDATTLWTELDIPQDQLALVKTYVYLRVRMIFDPPTTSFVIDAYNKQIEEHAVRLSYLREETIPSPVQTAEEIVYIPISTYIEGGYG